METFRRGARVLFARRLEALARGGRPPAAPYRPAAEAAAELEEAVHAQAGGPRADLAELALRVDRVSAALGAPRGPFPDDLAGLAFLRGEAGAAELADPGEEAEDPRQTLVRAFVRTLMEAHPAFADRARALRTAQALEASCYNRAIQLCLGAQRAVTRSWQSPAFVGIYSAGCGGLLQHLNPLSAPCRAYGTQLLCALAEGEVAPEALGALGERELCPAATADIRAELSVRSQQKIEKKVSHLFVCPGCGHRGCTYDMVQRRSLDEPATCVCFCLGCEKTFIGG